MRRWIGGINQLKNNKSKPFGGIILRGDDGRITGNGDEVLEVMQIYNKLNFYQKRKRRRETNKWR